MVSKYETPLTAPSSAPSAGRVHRGRHDADLPRGDLRPGRPVIAFDDEEEVIAAASGTTYGLASYLYTTNLAKATRINAEDPAAGFLPAAGTAAERPRGRA